ncbi:unnamed protein product [Prunus armeniaca]
METIVILVCYNEKWVTSKKMCKYEGGDSKGLIVPRTITFAELLDRVHQIGNTNRREDKTAAVNCPLQYLKTSDVHPPNDHVSYLGDQPWHVPFPSPPLTPNHYPTSSRSGG